MSQPQNAFVPEDRVRAAERLAAENQQFAVLGRYMVEMRHGFNNAMTSLLGNAELLLQDPGAFPARVLEQLQTIRAMALRMNQMMQRFSSLEAEMEIGESSSSENTPTIVQRKVGT
jgi:signal transduction histidine kinase